MHKGTRYPRQEPIPRENRESANDSLTFTVEEALILGRRLQARETLAIFQTLFNWFGTKVVALFNAWRRSWNEAKSIKLLSRLDDRTLRDIGIDVEIVRRFYLLFANGIKTTHHPLSLRRRIK